MRVNFYCGKQSDRIDGEGEAPSEPRISVRNTARTEPRPLEKSSPQQTRVRRKAIPILASMAATFFGLGMPVGLRATEPIPIGAAVELFVDNFLIDETRGTTLRLHEPRAAEDVLAFDKPWEGAFCGYVTVLRDGDRFRMYYRGLPVAGKDGSAAEVTCYAESRDGLAWAKPALGLYEAAGSRENNIVLKDHAPFSHNFAPFLDTRPGVPGDERYKALAGTSETGLVAFVSGDGLRWRMRDEKPVITKGAFDSQNVAFWSEPEQKYFCFYRTWSEGDWDGFRTVSKVESADFMHWSAPEHMFDEGASLDHIYTNQTTPYFRAPHLFVATAARFMPGRRVLSEAQAAAIGVDPKYFGDCSDVVLMTSRGGAHYTRTFREALVRPGMGLENWTSRTNYPACGLVPAGESEMAFYIQRAYGQPNHRLQRMVLRIDGFVSLNAPYAGGEMTTKPLRLLGERLHLNYATSAAGEVRVELLGAGESPIPGFDRETCDPLIGDEIDRVVTWKGQASLDSLTEKELRLRFILKDADLYAISAY